MNYNQILHAEKISTFSGSIRTTTNTTVYLPPQWVVTPTAAMYMNGSICGVEKIEIEGAVRLTSSGVTCGNSLPGAYNFSLVSVHSNATFGGYSLTYPSIISSVCIYPNSQMLNNFLINSLSFNASAPGMNFHCLLLTVSFIKVLLTVRCGDGVCNMAAGESYWKCRSDCRVCGVYERK
jgi:hypothetical protein